MYLDRHFSKVFVFTFAVALAACMGYCANVFSSKVCETACHPNVSCTAEARRIPTSQKLNSVVAKEQQSPTRPRSSLCQLRLNILLGGNVQNVPSSFCVDSRRGPDQARENLVATLVQSQDRFNKLAFGSTLFGEFDVNWFLDPSQYPGQMSSSKFVAVFGPNFLAGDEENQNPARFPDVFHVAPSRWAAEAWLQRGWKRVIGFVPTPVNASCWKRTKKKDPNHCVYYEKRVGERDFEASDCQVKKAKEWMERTGFKCERFVYGSYTIEDFRNALETASFGLVVDGTETQGYAIQQMMMMNVPLFFLLRSANQFHKVAPYADQTVGSWGTCDSPLKDFQNFLSIRSWLTPRTYAVQTVGAKAVMDKLEHVFCELKGEMQKRNLVESVMFNSTS